MRTVYKSKVDFWLVLVIAAACLVPFLAVSDLESLVIVSLVVLPMFALAFVALFGIRYIVEGATLTVKCGFFSSSSYNIAEIQTIAPTTTILSSPAASMDRLELAFGKRRCLVVSPAQKERFVSHLQQINPRILIKEGLQR